MQRIVNAEDDIENIRNNAAEKLTIPRFESLAHERVVCVAECAPRNVQCVVKTFALVHKQTDKLRNADRRMRVIKLYCVHLRKIINRAENALVTAENVAERCGGKEILLLQAQAFTLVCAVVGIKHTRNVLNGILFADGKRVFLRIERGKIKFLLRFALKQAESADC